MVFWNIAYVVPVVVGGRSDIETIDAMVVESGPLGGSLINYHLASGWGKGISVVVKIAVDKGICGETGLEV